MNLTKKVIKELEKRMGNTKPLLYKDATFPKDAYLYPEKEGKGFVFQQTNQANKYAFTLIEKIPTRYYQYCHARGFVSTVSEMADLIVEWCDESKKLEELNSKYPELVLFEPFTPKHKNDTIEKAWLKVKNHLFNNVAFWRKSDWFKLNDDIFSNARKMDVFENCFPFTSHYFLRFSLDENLERAWPLSLIIQPSHDLNKGKYQVSYREGWNKLPEYFSDVIEALNFLSKKMEEQKPI